MHFEVRAFSPNKGVQVLYWEVADEAEVKARASQEGLEVIGLRQATSTAHRTGNWKPWRAKHFSTHQFGQELLALLEAGFGLVEAIETLHSKENNEHDRSVVSGILRLLRGGASFSKALAAFPEQFPPLFLESIRASERTGDVPRALRRYLAYEEQLNAVRNHVIAASVYPAVLIVSGCLVLAFMLMYVVPRLAGAYENFRGAQPLLSRILFGWGEVVNAHGSIVLAAAAFGLVVLLRFALDGTVSTMLLRWARAIPAVGEQIRIYHLVRLYRTIGMLLEGGVPLVTALAMARGILPDDQRPALDAARHQIAEGQSLAASFKAAGLTTIVAERMFRIGERSGELALIMERIALFHDDRLAQWIKRFVKVFEPALMALIGALIGGIVLLMYMPIFELAGGLG